MSFSANVYRNFMVIPKISKRCFSTSGQNLENYKCKLLVVGGGSGGCSLSAKFAKRMKKDELIIVEPSDVHYYQALFTLVGAGASKLGDTFKHTKDVLPKNATWIKASAVEFSPKKNEITLSNGDIINYDYMVIGVGLQLNYDKIPGLLEALQLPNSGVCSNYSPMYVNKTFDSMEKLKSGNAIFTFPNTPVKCPGAPQKICYLTDHYLRKVQRREKVNVIYNTSLPVIFGVKKYADALWKVVNKRNINVNLRTNLIEIKPKEKVAIFQNLDKPDEKKEVEYSMLHVTPPMSPPDSLKNCKELTNEVGFVDVNKETLQHAHFPNIFALGDCSSSPNSKTAAAVAAQCKVVYDNLLATMDGRKLVQTYDGYASCPLVTGYNRCIMAEFDYDLKPLETFPISQDREMRSMYFVKKNVIPSVYWNLMLNGLWNGPAKVRKLLHLGLK